MLVEFVIYDKSYWLRAPVKTWDAKDLQACMLEQNHQPQNPEDLFRVLKTICPTNSKELFETCSKGEVKNGVDPSKVFKFRNPALIKKIPEFQWDAIFAQAGLKLNPKRKRGRRGKRMRDDDAMSVDE